MQMGSSASGDDDYTICRDDGTYQYDVPLPHPLPMPEYGGYFAPLIEYIPENIQPSNGFHRSVGFNVAVIIFAGAYNVTVSMILGVIWR